MADVTFDAVHPGATGTSVHGVNTTLSWNHVTADHPNRLLVVALSLSDGSDNEGPKTISGVTCDGLTMTPTAVRHSGDDIQGFIQMFYITGQAVGTNVIVATQTNSGTNTDLIGASLSFYNVDQGTPTRNFDSAAAKTGAPSLSISSATGNMVVDLACNGKAILTSGQSMQWNLDLTTATAAGNAASSTAAGASSVTMSYTTTADWWAIMGFDINAVAANPATDNKRRSSLAWPLPIGVPPCPDGTVS